MASNRPKDGAKNLKFSLPIRRKRTSRCYHSTAILSTVLSAGGGEYNPDGPIQRKDVPTDAQIFHPPYLFRGERPVITVAPTKADYNTTFSIRVSGPPPKRVTAVKLGSVTHSLDSNQRFNDLQKLNLRFAGVSAARVCIRWCRMPREPPKEEV